MRLDHLLSKETLVCREQTGILRSGHEESSFSALFNLEGADKHLHCTLKTEQRAKDKQGNRRQKFEANCGKTWVTISTDGKPNGACIILENQ